jgi:hypothetical protein
LPLIYEYSRKKNKYLRVRSLMMSGCEKENQLAKLNFSNALDMRLRRPVGNHQFTKD